MTDRDSDGAKTFGEYILQGDVSKRQRAENWRIAIGLQGVDQLTNSKYLLETAREQIEGHLDFAGVEKRISDYYKTAEGRALYESRFDDPDFVSPYGYIYWKDDIPTKNVSLSEKMSEKIAGNVGENTSVSENIISMIIDDNEISANKIASKLNLASRTIERYIEKLKAAGRLRRIGPDKGGHWEVIEQ